MATTSVPLSPPLMSSLQNPSPSGTGTATVSNTAGPTNLNTLPTQSQSQSKQKANAPPTTFEFTKRKRWADLLIHELSEAIVLVLSADCRIWFCNRAVSELLGWKDTELIDNDFAGLVAADGQTRFRDIFEQSKRTGEEFMCYSRLTFKGHLAYPHQRHPAANIDLAGPSHSAFAASSTSSLMPASASTSSMMGKYDGGVGASLALGMDMPPPLSPVDNDAAQEPLFEIKARPHYIEDEREPRCFFAVAKPYPGASMSQLNTVLDYKIGAQHLEHRLARLKAARSQPHAPTASSLYSTAGPSSLTDPSALYDATMPPPSSSSDSFGNSYSLPPPTAGVSAGAAPVSVATTASQQAVLGDTSEYGDEARRKKMKKTHTSEQYVCKTCGRTDSPEWRKGPQGPKTLCNACGLRWAKMLRIRQEEEQATMEAAGNGDGSAGSGPGPAATAGGTGG